MKTLNLATVDDIQRMEHKLERSIDELKNLLNKKGGTKKEFLKTKEACAYLSVSYGKLKKLRIDGILNPSKIGKEFYYSLDEINSLLDNSNVE